MRFEDTNDGNFNIVAINEYLQDDERFLPIRISCSAHTLNLIGTTDSFNALANESYAEMYVDVFRKLNLLWNASTSRLKSENIQKYLGKKNNTQNTLEPNL